VLAYSCGLHLFCSVRFGALTLLVECWEGHLTSHTSNRPIHRLFFGRHSEASTGLSWSNL